jgi:cytochrome c oxidase subunit 2
MFNRFKLCKIALAFSAFFCTHQALAAPDNWQLNMFKGVTPISRDIYHLHMIAMLVCTLIGVVVFGVMIYSLIRHRKSKGYVPATFHDNTKLEILWSIIPFLILVALAIPATTVLINMENSSNADVTIKIVGHQWKWEYQYLDEGVHFYSNLSTPYAQIQNLQEKGQWYLLEVDKPLVLPTHKKVRFLVTSDDVVHSWWVPELGVKRDAIPGFMHEAWARIEEEGTYRGQCAELCGINHGFMPIVVEAVNEKSFDAWVAKQTKIEKEIKVQDLISTSGKPSQAVMTREQLMTLGKEKYLIHCAACHQADGTGIPPMYPALKKSSVAVGYPISRHIDIILKGIPGSAMQGYQEELTNEEIAAITTYERNAWDNNTNDLVQPSEVESERQANIQQPKMVKKAKAGGFR